MAAQDRRTRDGAIAVGAARRRTDISRRTSLRIHVRCSSLAGAPWSYCWRASPQQGDSAPPSHRPSARRWSAAACACAAYRRSGRALRRCAAPATTSCVRRGLPPSGRAAPTYPSRRSARDARSAAPIYFGDRKGCVAPAAIHRPPNAPTPPPRAAAAGRPQGAATIFGAKRSIFCGASRGGARSGCAGRRRAAFEDLRAGFLTSTPKRAPPLRIRQRCATPRRDPAPMASAAAPTAAARRRRALLAAARHARRRAQRRAAPSAARTAASATARLHLLSGLCRRRLDERSGATHQGRRAGQRRCSRRRCCRCRRGRTRHLNLGEANAADEERPTPARPALFRRLALTRMLRPARRAGAAARRRVFAAVPQPALRRLRRRLVLSLLASTLGCDCTDLLRRAAVPPPPPSPPLACARCRGATCAAFADVGCASLQLLDCQCDGCCALPPPPPPLPSPSASPPPPKPSPAPSPAAARPNATAAAAASVAAAASSAAHSAAAAAAARAAAADLDLVALAAGAIEDRGGAADGAADAPVEGDAGGASPGGGGGVSAGGGAAGACSLGCVRGCLKRCSAVYRADGLAPSQACYSRCSAACLPSCVGLDEASSPPPPRREPRESADSEP